MLKHDKKKHTNIPSRGWKSEKKYKLSNCVFIIHKTSLVVNYKVCCHLLDHLFHNL